MIQVIIRLIILVAMISFISFAARRLFSMIKNYQPNKKNVKKDVDNFRLGLAARNQDLVPWNKEEMELLSLNEVEQKINKRGTKTIEGTLLSIYQEPMVQYSYKKYVQQNNAVLIAKTSNREYIYRVRKKGIQIYMNNEPLGLLRTNGVLYTPDKRGVAQIKSDKQEFSTPILVDNKEKGSLLNPDKTDKEVPRAFELLAPMQKREEDYFLSLAILELAMRNITK
ncbi:MAG: hypothetical protein ACI97N_001935 [Cognaticolwellia sp.]|jgi:hypothetical protein